MSELNDKKNGYIKGLSIDPDPFADDSYNPGMVIEGSAGSGKTLFAQHLVAWMRSKCATAVVPPVVIADTGAWHSWAAGRWPYIDGRFLHDPDNPRVDTAEALDMPSNFLWNRAKPVADGTILEPEETARQLRALLENRLARGEPTGVLHPQLVVIEEPVVEEWQAMLDLGARLMSDPLLAVIAITRSVPDDGLDPAVRHLLPHQVTFGDAGGEVPDGWHAQAPEGVLPLNQAPGESSDFLMRKGDTTSHGQFVLDGRAAPPSDGNLMPRTCPLLATTASS